jgi:hypothetical protein
MASQHLHLLHRHCRAQTSLSESVSEFVITNADWLTTIWVCVDFLLFCIEWIPPGLTFGHCRNFGVSSFPFGKNSG